MAAALPTMRARSHATRARWVVIVIGALVAPVAAHAQQDDAAALALADRATLDATPSRNWHGFITGSAYRASLREPQRMESGNAQLFAQLRYDSAFAPEWRAVMADLLMLERNDDLLGRRAVNTLIDAYLSWQPRPDRVVDAGRINTRFGVALGFNPTDYFRSDSVRSILSIDPASLRANREGSVMVRGQALWGGGSVVALYSPKLADHPTPSGWDPDVGATNPRDRWLVAVAQRVTAGIEPQLLLQGGARQSLQVGFNVTAVVGSAAVAYLEASVGRSPTLLAQALGPPDEALRAQGAAGVTYTTPHNVSVTLELEYNGAGLDRAALDALQRRPFATLLGLYPRYRLFAARMQSPPTTQRAFASVLWKDALADRLDVASFLYYDRIDSSRQWWAEARYRWAHDVDTALQWQLNSGRPASDFGVVPARHVWQVLATWYF